MLVPGFKDLDCNRIINNSFFNGMCAEVKKTKRNFIAKIQTALNVTSDGIAGTDTIKATVTVSKTKNNKHPVVRPLQEYLNYLGYNCGIADGIAGSKFENAVKQFQKDYGCVSDGELTAQKTTWKKLLTI